MSTMRGTLLGLWASSHPGPTVVVTALAAALSMAAGLDLGRTAVLTLAVFALGRVLSLVPLTPGGAGITETVGAAALVALGVSAADAAGAMLLLMVTMLLVPLLLGALAAAVAIGTRSTSP